MAQNFNIGTSYNSDYLTKYMTNSSFDTNNKNEGLEGVSNKFGDYNSVKANSYNKLVSAYYNKEKTEGVSLKQPEKNSTIINYKNLQGAATSLKSASRELQKDSMFTPEIKSVKDPSTGKIKVSEELDWNRITTAVSSFAVSYNNTISELSNNSNSVLLNKGNYLTKLTEANSSSLSSIGIDTENGKNLRVDKEKLKEAGANSIKAVLASTNSYGWTVGDRASQIEALSKNSVNKMSRLYDGQGKYKTAFNADSLINDYF